MIKFLAYCVIAASFLSGFRDLKKLLGPAAQVLAESPNLISGFLLVAILFTLGKTRGFALAPKYMLVGFFLVLHMLLGAILNSVDPGTIFSGIRIYFAFLPMLLLPVVYQFSEREITNISKFVLLFCLLQVPVSLYQWVFVYPEQPTGDVIRGTFQTGAIMSITLVGAVLILVGLFLRGKILFLPFCILALALLFPTTINETKGTLILLPVGLLGMGIFTASGKARFRNLLVVSSAIGLFITSFVVAYDYFFSDKHDSIGLTRFYTERAATQFYKGAERGDGAVGRLDSILYAYDDLKDDLTSLAFGRGLGNVSHPETMEVMRGEFTENYVSHGIAQTTYTILLWEVGIIGILLTLLTLAMICADAIALQSTRSMLGGLSFGWVGVAVMLPVAFLYKDVINPGVVGHLGMFYSGIVVAERLRTLVESKYHRGMGEAETYV